jgi:hypothetical protein
LTYLTGSTTANFCTGTHFKPRHTHDQLQHYGGTAKKLGIEESNLHHTQTHTHADKHHTAQLANTMQNLHGHHDGHGHGHAKQHASSMKNLKQDGDGRHTHSYDSDAARVSAPH